MVSRLNQLIEQNRQEQISLRKAELALLQAQINPHFLYNTLDAIVWLVEMEKNEQAVEMVTSLSSFRSSLSNGRDIITLREEEQHVSSWRSAGASEGYSGARSAIRAAPAASQS